MKYEEIMNLVNAGFTKDEILRLAGLQPAAEPAPAPDPKPEPAQTAEPAPAAPVAPAPAAPAQDMLDRILGKFDEMNRSMQEMAIRQSQQPKPETADDILAAIIRPPERR